ncbi:hypothetical protein VTO73DRAFT_15479 [Trametes versicolor]
MRRISSSQAQFIGLWLQLLMTGAYLAYFPQCVAILRRKLRKGLSPLIPVSCGVIFAVVVTGATLTMIRTFAAFTAHGGGKLPDPDRYYASPATPIGLAKNALGVVMSVISDVIIVYRTFIVWDVNALVIIFPTCLLLTNLGLGIRALVALAHVRADDPASLVPVGPSIQFFVILTFCLNMFCAGASLRAIISLPFAFQALTARLEPLTGMICWRIWTKSHGLARGLAAAGAVQRVFETVLQTAALHCALLLVMIVLNTLNFPNESLALVDLLMPLQAFVFTVLIVRTNVHNNQPTITVVSMSALAWQSATFGTSSTSRGARTTNPPQEVEIDLECIVHTDADSITSPPRYPHGKSTFVPSDSELVPEQGRVEA